MFDTTNHREFLNLAILFEGALVLVALGIAWIVDVDPLAAIAWSVEAVVWGTAAAVPMFLLFLLSQWYPVGSLRPIKRFLVELLGPPLAVCRWYELVLLAMLAGVCEEVLFRGVLQTWLVGKWGLAAGLIVSNVLFGLAHLITPTYAVLAGLIGVYLGLVMHATEPPNWLTPAVTHAVYDFLAFIIVARAYRQEQRGDDSAHQPPNDEALAGSTES